MLRREGVSTPVGSGFSVLEENGRRFGVEDCARVRVFRAERYFCGGISATFSPVKTALAYVFRLMPVWVVCRYVLALRFISESIVILACECWCGYGGESSLKFTKYDCANQ